MIKNKAVKREPISIDAGLNLAAQGILVAFSGNTGNAPACSVVPSENYISRF